MFQKEEELSLAHSKALLSNQLKPWSMKFYYLYHRWVLLTSTENGRQIFLFRVPDTHANKWLFWKLLHGKASVTYLSVFAWATVFSWDRLRAIHRAVGRELNEISASSLRETAICTPLCCWHCGRGSRLDVFSQLATKCCGSRGNREKQLGMTFTYVKCLPCSCN